MKIEQWVEQRYAILDGLSDHNEQSFDGYAFVRLDKVMQEFERIGPVAHGLELSKNRKHYMGQDEKMLIDLNFVLRLFLAHTHIAHDLLRKLIVWCAVYNEAV